MKKTKKLLTLAISLLLTVFLLAACGGGSSSSAASGSGGSSSASTGSGSSASSSASTAASASNTPKEIRKVDITVNPGDVIFDNEIMKLTYVGLGRNKDYINCRIDGKSKVGISIAADTEPLVINGKLVDYTDYSWMPMKPYKEGENIGGGNLGIQFATTSSSALQLAGITIDELKTIQATITITPFEFDNKNVLFEITVLFNIQ